MVSDMHRPDRDCKGDTILMKNPLLPFKARITGVRIDTDDVRTLTLRLKTHLDMKPGQFNMIGYPGVGEAPISASSINGKGEIQHTIRAVGRVTGFISSLNEGSEIFIRGPYGKGWPMDAAEGNDLLIVAGGVGIAPLRPVIHEVIKKRGAFGKVTVIYGVRDEKNAVYIDELEEWKDIHLLVTADEATGGGRWKYGTGSVLTSIDNARIVPAKTSVFMCGPEIMMRLAGNKLLMKGILASRLYVSLERRMKCGIGHCGHCQHNGRFVCKEGPVFPYKEMRGLPDGLL